MTGLRGEVLYRKLAMKREAASEAMSLAWPGRLSGGKSGKVFEGFHTFYFAETFASWLMSRCLHTHQNAYRAKSGNRITASLGLRARRAGFRQFLKLNGKQRHKAR